MSKATAPRGRYLNTPIGEILDDETGEGVGYDPRGRIDAALEDGYYRRHDIDEALRAMAAGENRGRPLCGSCLEFHSDPNNDDACEQVYLMMHADQALWAVAIG